MIYEASASERQIQKEGAEINFDNSVIPPSEFIVRKTTVTFLLLFFFILMNSQTIYPMAAVSSVFILAVYGLSNLRASRIHISIFYIVCLNIVYWIVNIIMHDDSTLFVNVDFYRRDGKGFYIFFMLLVLIVVNRRSSYISGRISFFSKGLVIIGNIIAIITLLDYFRIIPALSLITSGIGTGIDAKGLELSSGFFNNHNALAGYLGSIILISMVYYMETLKKFWLIMSLPLVSAFSITSSRAFFISAVVLISIYMLFSGSRRRIGMVDRRRFKVAMSIMTLVAIVVTFQLSLGINRIHFDKSIFKEHNIAYRFVLWSRAIKYIDKSPVFGLGVGSFNDDFNFVTTVFPHVLAVPKEKTRMFNDQHAHNFILHLLAETGIVGLTLFLLLLYSIYKRSRRLLMTDSTNAVVVGKITILLLLYQFVGSMVANNFFAPSSSMLFWMFASFSFMRVDVQNQQTVGEIECDIETSSLFYSKNN